MSTLDLTLEPEPVEVRRLEVITGVGRRRTWSDDAKARIVAETLRPGANVSAVARRHGLRPQQVFTWRRLARRHAAGLPAGEPVAFASVVIAPPAVPDARQPAAKRAPAEPVEAAAIEIEIDGVVVRVRRGSDLRTLTAVIRALKRRAP
jgi:transposase